MRVEILLTSSESQLQFRKTGFVPVDDGAMFVPLLLQDCAIFGCCARGLCHDGPDAFQFGQWLGFLYAVSASGLGDSSTHDGRGSLRSGFGLTGRLPWRRVEHLNRI